MLILLGLSAGTYPPRRTEWPLSTGGGIGTLSLSHVNHYSLLSLSLSLLRPPRSQVLTRLMGGEGIAHKISFLGEEEDWGEKRSLILPLLRSRKTDQGTKSVLVVVVVVAVVVTISVPNGQSKRVWKRNTFSRKGCANRKQFIEMGVKKNTFTKKVSNWKSFGCEKAKSFLLIF